MRIWSRVSTMLLSTFCKSMKLYELRIFLRKTRFEKQCFKSFWKDLNIQNIFFFLDTPFQARFIVHSQWLVCVFVLSVVRFFYAVFIVVAAKHVVEPALKWLFWIWPNYKTQMKEPLSTNSPWPLTYLQYFQLTDWWSATNY